ncbi:dTDP-4-dehydrorhamnose reductase [Granulicella sp. WH15]|uniref:dTDP-4-dehydrorhamnose reductase n=1 Tax=Granulicella sp. WH15 TaxID=2602070 RepID=UPI0013679973|nr:dTDP-4-dehydrorhamnose reductase [Granulicella sp. WH15]QHN02120.1 dTDP-4-dehydrorhamnose reductase [Granulicella sp. WH15]
MRILLTGSTGQVGSELLPVLERLGEVIAPSRGELDLADPTAVGSLIRELRPRWIVNPAAYTAVDKAESEPELADAINHRSVGAMGLAAKAVGATILHFSTDYVFDGEGAQPYREIDPTHPAGVYGASKLAGEQALAASGAAYLIFRTSWVYGATGKNFLRTILGLARQREQMKIVADQHGAPTWSRDLANMAAHVIQFCEQREAVAPLSGIYHAAGEGETSWFGFARRGIELRQPFEPETRFAELLPIPTSEYPTPARRPLNSRLDCRKLQQTFGWRMMDWQESLAQVVSDL